MSIMLPRIRSQSHIITGVLLTISWLVIYLFTVSPTVNFIDSGELITAAYEPGIAHPPGYPLYILMGYVVTHLLWGEVAWRLNVLSAFWAAICVGTLFFLIVTAISYISWSRTPRTQPQVKRGRGTRSTADVVPQPKAWSTAQSPWVLVAAAGAASLLGASTSFWSRSAQAKMYSLHFFFVALLFWLALQYRWAYERDDAPAARRWLVGLVAAGALSFTNHLMTNLLLPGLALIVFSGANVKQRIQAVLQQWRVLVPALLPLLLYLYLPLRAAQSPYMNWGSPDTFGDFRRHVGVWQYQAYFLQDPGGNIGRIITFALQQWGLLTFPVVLTSFIAGAYLFRLNRGLFLGTFATAATTLLFSIGYSISEIEPYLIPIYMMIVIWLGVVAAWLATTLHNADGKTRVAGEAQGRQYIQVAIILLVAGAVVALFLQYPQQDRSRDRMAPALVRNVFTELPRDSILITDNWDFYAPTYYLQRVMGERPDITVIDMSLLRYPWYTDQMRMNDPELLAKSEDLVAPFSAELAKWVEGDTFDRPLLTNLYSSLLTSFVERSPERRSYVLFNAPCNAPQAPQGCEGNQVAPTFARYPSGLAMELVKQENRPEPPVFPDYDLRGITSERIRLDDVAVGIAQHYVTTYRHLSRLYELTGRQEAARQAEARAVEIILVLEGKQ